jgi:AhpD family alkylhydroperoxidase
MALTLKERELVAVGSSLAAGCKPCTNYHLREVRQAEASDAEIHQAVADALQVRRDATQVMERHGRERLGASREDAGRSSSEPATRIRELVSVGAAFAVNCTSSLERHLKAGQRVGIAEEEIQEVVGLAAFIRRMAASHVERLVGMTQVDEAAQKREGPAKAGSCC